MTENPNNILNIYWSTSSCCLATYSQPRTVEFSDNPISVELESAGSLYILYTMSLRCTRGAELPLLSSRIRGDSPTFSKTRIANRLQKATGTKEKRDKGFP